MKKIYADIVTVLMVILILLSVIMILEGRRKMAVEFDGIQEQGFSWGDVSLLENLDGDWPQKTIVVWLEKDTYTNDTVLVKCEGTGSVINWALWIDASSDGDMYFRQVFSSNAGGWLLSGGTPVTTGSKHMVAVMYDNTSTANDPSFFVDGTQYADNDFSTPSGSLLEGTPSYFNIGQGVGSSFYSIDGRIYAVVIYDRILSESELDDLYAARSIKSFRELEGLVFLADMDSASGVRSIDGHVFSSGEHIIDEVTGYPGNPGNSQPTGVADDYLHR